MNELFIIIIILIVLWFINEHTKKVEKFESNGEKIELSLCDLVTLFKKLIVREVNDARSVMQQQVVALEPVMDIQKQQAAELVPVMRQQIQPIISDLKDVSVENKNINMNIINNIEPHDLDDLNTNHSLLDSA